MSLDTGKVDLKVDQGNDCTRALKTTLHSFVPDCNPKSALDGLGIPVLVRSAFLSCLIPFIFLFLCSFIPVYSYSCIFLLLYIHIPVYFYSCLFIFLSIFTPVYFFLFMSSCIPVFSYSCLFHSWPVVFCSTCIPVSYRYSCVPFLTRHRFSCDTLSHSLNC